MQLSEARWNRQEKLEAETRMRLETLARRVHRLCPDHRDPHKFHEEKSEIAFELKQLSRRIA